MFRCAIIASAIVMAGQATAEITSARYADPTTRYDHGVLGDAIEHGTLELSLRDGRNLRIVLPETRVFEDTEPRLKDVDGDGKPEVITVETDMARGARLAIYGETGLIAATPFIGRTRRWLAPIGVADLNADGFIEIAYIDRPHLAKLLRVWRFKDGQLSLVSELPGLTNHRIGESDIGGGIRDCGDGPEIITASADWSTVNATSFKSGALVTKVIGPYKTRASFERALDCTE